MINKIDKIKILEKLKTECPYRKPIECYQCAKYIFLCGGRNGAK